MYIVAVTVKNVRRALLIGGAKVQVTFHRSLMGHCFTHMYTTSKATQNLQIVFRPND